MSRNFSPFFMFRYFISRVYHSILLRIFFVLAILICFAYYTLLVPWFNRSLAQQYLQQTGHQLQYDKVNIQLFKCHASVNHLKDLTGLWQANRIDIDFACMQSVRERSFVINEIKVKQLNANLFQQENGVWNFDDILKHQQAESRATLKKSQSSQSQSSSQPVVIKKLSIINSTVHSKLADFKHIPIDAALLNFTVSDIDLRIRKLLHFSLNTELNQSTNISLAGQINLASLSGSLDVDAQNIPFVWFNTLLAPYVRLEVLSGAIELHKHIEITAGVPQKISGHGKLTNLKLRPTSMEQDAVKWKSLEWENAEILLAEKSIHLPVLRLDQLDGQFIVDKDRKTNVQAMVVTPPATTSTASPDIPKEQRPWQFAIDRLDINNAAIGFYDQSLIPSFTAIVQNFTGNITDISSNENTVASIDMKGNVGGYAPVTLKGKANLFRTYPMLDALLSFKQMDMGTLSPYSAQYAGWKINKGLLSADLNYHYEEGKILGKNHVVIDHLEFGEKVRGARAIDIPLRLGLAMLTDARGIAVLDTEISGTTSDPQFKFRDVIIRALSNSLKKIVSAPFRFISNLLNTKEDLGKIQFTAGESQLSDAAKAKLQLLTEALHKRPNMRLSVQGTYDQNGDVIALKEEQVKSALQKAGLEPDSLKTHDVLWVNFVNEKYAALSVENTNSTLSVEEKYQALIENENVDPSRLSHLAHERALAVKQYFILQLGVSGDTVLLNSETRCEKTQQCATSEVVFTLEV